MKIKNILLTGVAALALVSCNDYLDVDAPSAYTEDFVFSQKSEIERALNGVYAQALSNDLYGNAYQRTFILNSDVDMQTSNDDSHSHTSYFRFDCDDQGGDIQKFWTAAYNLIEYCNKFIASAEESSFCVNKVNDSEWKQDVQVLQWIGEAKCLRAMAYHDMVVMFGDVPFTFTSASRRSEYVFPVTDREEIQDSLIEDLKGISTYMSPASSVTVERCSKEFAQGLIARIALTAAGWSLRPGTDSRSYGSMQCPSPEKRRAFFEIARDYADSVIVAGSHRLSNTYQQVFINECNYQVVNDDDPIFEIPFAKESTGNTGYIQGPTYTANEGKTVGVWGECSGNGRLSAFYRFLFRPNDKRREFINGMWYYALHTYADGTMADSAVIRNDYTVHNNKWSKLWTAEGSALGNVSSGATGINYPYMRYADVLLMYAEAANELNGGPTEKAVRCLTEVHNRAFDDGDPDFISAAQSDQETFRKAVLDERKWEFAGENSRWRDLVRTNTYAEELVYSFLRYYAAGIRNAGSPTDYESYINAHDGNLYNIGRLPTTIHWHPYNISEIKTAGLRRVDYRSQLYGYIVDASGNVVQSYPNQVLQSVRIFNAYERADEPMTRDITNAFNANYTWAHTNFYRWGNSDTGLPNDYCKYSFYGYIRCDANGRLLLNDNGTLVQLDATIPSSDQLPVVRYILPYPNMAIQRSSGAYKNYYGY